MIAFDPIYTHPVPQNHRFPMEKYALLYEALLWEGIAEPTDFFTPEPASFEHLILAHNPTYVRQFLSLTLPQREAIRIGFQQSEQLVRREVSLVGGTLQGAQYALENGCAFNIAGGTHHAFSNRGEGFCMLNDQAVAAAYLLKNLRISPILIIDLDVHQGNGTAEIFAHTPEVFTFSMHATHNYPFEKETSDWDIPLPDDTGDERYLSVLDEALRTLFDRVQPRFVFYQSGVDVLQSDKLGRLSLTLEGCKQRDTLVYEYIQRYGLPIQCSMGGGYSPKIDTILKAHTNTFRVFLS